MISDAERCEIFRSGFRNYSTTKGIFDPTVQDYEGPRIDISYPRSCLVDRPHGEGEQFKHC